MLKRIKPFLKSQSGNVTIFFALGAIPLCAAVGAAVDYGRASSAQVALQAATDAAALAVAADPKLSDKVAEQMMHDFLIANGMEKDVAQVVNVGIRRDKKKGTVSVDATGTFNTSLMGIVGISDLKIGGHSQVQNGGQALEVALVLDNTYSMTADNRIAALKSASHAMVDQLLASSDTDSQISIVPFSEYVNVGMANRNAIWINVKADYDEQQPTYIPSNCKQVAGASDGIGGVTSQQCDWTLDPSGATWTKENRWTGCVGSRDGNLDTRIDQIATRYTGLLNGEHPSDWWISCPQELTSLTKNKSKLSKAIDNMNPTGETYIPIGLLWGWNTLDAAVPLTEAKTTQEMADARGSKALVLMTDGDNTIKPVQYPWHSKTDGSANWGDVANQKTTELCDSIKAAGISIFTVALKVTNSQSKQLLENCASQPSMAFSADDNTALVEAFKEIAGQLVAVHLSK